MNKDTARVSVVRFYPPRRRDSRKGDYGRVIIVGGSERYAGCLAFNALAALRAGADLAIVVAPRRAADIVAGYSPDLITIPCASPFPDPRTVAEVLVGADSLVVGCGVVRTGEAHEALTSIIRKSSVPVVVDAEALHAIAVKPEVCYGKRILLTPNAWEYQQLGKQPWPASSLQRIRAVRALARHYKATVIVKGAEDYISDGARVHVDHEGSPYMTKGGYGDLVAGVAGAMLARGNDPFEAARVAAYLVGKAGRMASKAFGEATLASDTLTQLAFVVAKRR